MIKDIGVAGWQLGFRVFDYHKKGHQLRVISLTGIRHWFLGDVRFYVFLSYGDIAKVDKNTNIMKRDNELRERRNMAIFKRFNELITGEMTHEAIYCQLEDEFFISSITIKQIVLRITRTHGKQIL